MDARQNFLRGNRYSVQPTRDMAGPTHQANSQERDGLVVSAAWQVLQAQPAHGILTVTCSIVFFQVS